MSRPRTHRGPGPGSRGADQPYPYGGGRDLAPRWTQSCRAAVFGARESGGDEWIGRSVCADRRHEFADCPALAVGGQASRDNGEQARPVAVELVYDHLRAGRFGGCVDSGYDPSRIDNLAQPGAAEVEPGQTELLPLASCPVGRGPARGGRLLREPAQGANTICGDRQAEAELLAERVVLEAHEVGHVQGELLEVGRVLRSRFADRLVGEARDLAGIHYRHGSRHEQGAHQADCGQLDRQAARQPSTDPSYSDAAPGAANPRVDVSVHFDLPPGPTSRAVP
jgi:hypothetical protein